mgnify:CR=1 FL=1
MLSVSTLLIFSYEKTFEFNDIIRWNVDGKSFEITSPRKFINSVAPKYYKLKNMNSFLKQVIFKIHPNKLIHLIFRR